MNSMRRSIITALVQTLFVLFGLSAGEKPSPANSHTVKSLPTEIVAKLDNMNDQYWLFLPKHYKESKQDLPLIIYLHGSSRRGRAIDKVITNGLPAILSGHNDFKFVVASPQALSKYPWQKCWRPDDINLLLDHLLTAYKIDHNRVYITGLSMGGYGTWAAIGKHSKRFAAAIPICGGGEPAWGKTIKLPVWAFHGEEDYVVPIQRSKEMVQAVNHAGGPAKLTTYPNVGHDSFTQTYNNPKVFEWLLEHTIK